MLVDLARASELFSALPDCLRWPTLSPQYVVADAARTPELMPVLLAVQRDGGVLLHCVHEARIPGTDACDWQSAYGYGGPLSHGLDASGLARAWEELDAEAAARRVVAEFVRFHPMADNHHAYPGTVRADRPVVAVPLDVADLLAAYSGRARTAIRKAERTGLRATWETVEEARLAFPPFYRRCMREIGAGDFYLFGDDYFDALLGLPGARVLSVLRGDDRLSMGLFLFGPEQAEYHLSGTLEAGRRDGATNLLLHVAAQSARDQGCKTLYLGGGTGASREDPLLRFKESFATAGGCFRIGHRIHNPAAYEGLRAAHPDLAAASKRVLFYRK